jgi:3-deoxy-D-manno-octulosonic-acid transferase
MKYFWFIVYNFLFLPLFWAVAKFLSLFNNKLKIAFKARKDLFKFLSSKINSLDPNKKNILIHCSSLGEFEQSKPIIDELDKLNKYNFIISFFSPSGYNHSKIDSPLNSKIIKTYLPFDSVGNIKKFIKLIKPNAVIFIKYDLWPNLLKEIYTNNIFSFVVNSAIDIRKFKWRFKPYISFKRYIYSFINSVAVTDDEDMLYFKKILKGTQTDMFVFGDTKYERISKAKLSAQNSGLLNQNIINNKNIFVIGSSWDKDIDVILPVLNKISSNGISEKLSLLTILVPHEPTENNIENIEFDLSQKYSNLKFIRYSELNKYKDENLIIVDCIGILMGLYKYAKIAYVGGGYQSGLHNVLEPAGYGIPVLFGDEKLSEDAELLIKNGGGIAVEDSKELYKYLLNFLRNNDYRYQIGCKSLSVFDSKNEASKKIAHLINSKI